MDEKLDGRVRFLTFKPIDSNHQPKHFGWVIVLMPMAIFLP
jgi:hypothetical protein